MFVQAVFWGGLYEEIRVTLQGIILAAGRGSRMGVLTDNLPKCRTMLHGKELIQWQLVGLKGAGVEEIAMVRGYLAETFDFCVTYFENSRWADTNMVKSLVAADDWLKADTCVVSYSDIVYSQNAVRRLVVAEGDITITYDPNWHELWKLRFDDPLSDAETFRLQGNRVVEIGNRAETIEEIEGQYMGLLKFTPYGWQQVMDYLGGFKQKEQDLMDMTKLLQGLIAAGVDICAIPIGDQWFEVDSEKDLVKYEGVEIFENANQ